MRTWNKIMFGIALALSALSIAACSGEQPAQPEVGIELHEYTVRGVVTQLPSETRDFRVHHAAIPDFVGPARALGMNEMVMPFPLAAGVTVGEEIAVGDKVEIVFVVSFDTTNERPASYETTSVVELEADAEVGLKASL